MAEQASWYGRRPSITLTQWDDEFLSACQASGSIIECNPEDRSTVAVWARLAGWAVVLGGVIGTAWLLYLR